MRKSIIIAISMMAIAVSCAKNLEEAVNAPQPKMKELTLTLSAEPQPKVTLQNDLSATWDAGDSISVLVAGQNCKFIATTSGANVDFTGSIPETAEISKALVIYPFNSDITVADDTLATVTFPYKQKVSKLCNMMAGKVVAQGEGTLNVGMKNVGGLVEFTITRTDITSVSILSNNNRKDWMAGQATLYLNGEGLPVINTNSSQNQYSSVVALPDGDVFVPGTYYVAVPAKVYSKGIIVRMQNTEKKYASKTGTSALEVQRSHIKPISTIDNDVVFAVEVHTSILDYNASNYANCGICTWPFKEGEINAGNRAQWLGKDTTLTTLAEGYMYHIYADTYIQNTNSNCQGFKIGSTINDYLQFPVIEGCGLIRAEIQIGNYNNSNIVSLYVVKNLSDTLYRHENLKTAGTSFSFTFNDPKEGDIYRVCHDAGHSMSFRAIDCYYKTVSAGSQTVSNVTAAVSDTLTVAGTTARINATFECQNFSPSCQCGVEYKAYGASSWTSVSPSSVAKAFTVNLTGLEPNTLYYVRSWALGKDDVSRVYSSEKTFVTRGPEFTLDLTFGDSSSSDVLYKQWKETWGLDKDNTKAVIGKNVKQFFFNGAAYCFELFSSKGYGYRYASSTYHGLCLLYPNYEGTFYGYLKTPVLPGMYVSKLIVNEIGANGNVYLATSVDSETGAPAGTYETWATGGTSAKSKTWTLTDTNVTPYYIVIGKRLTTFTRLRVTYTKAE